MFRVCQSRSLQITINIICKVPGDFIIYSLPIWARLPANHGLSLVWTLILSSMRGDKIEVPAEEEVVVGSIGTKEQGQEE